MGGGIRLISQITKSVTDLIRVAILGMHDPSFSEVIKKKEKRIFIGLLCDQEYSIKFNSILVTVIGYWLFIF